MRAGLLSKVMDHILLLMEDLYIGIRDKHLIVPCPHCVCNAKSSTRMRRSFSDVLALLPDKERREREELERRKRGMSSRGGADDMEEEEEERGTAGREAILNGFSEIGRTEKVQRGEKHWRGGGGDDLLSENHSELNKSHHLTLSFSLRVFSASKFDTSTFNCLLPPPSLSLL